MQYTAARMTHYHQQDRKPYSVLDLRAKSISLELEMSTVLKDCHVVLHRPLTLPLGLRLSLPLGSEVAWVMRREAMIHVKIPTYNPAPRL